MTLEEHFKYSEYIAIRYFRRHKKVFTAHGYKLADLKQEAKIVCLQTHRKYEDKDGQNGLDLKKMIALHVGRKMNNLLKGAIVNSSRLYFVDDENRLEALSAINRMSGDANNCDVYDYNSESSVFDRIDLPREAINVNEFIDGLKSERDRDIATKILVEGMSFTEVLKSLGLRPEDTSSIDRQWTAIVQDFRVMLAKKESSGIFLGF
jgi:hypothetical protein